MICPNGRCLVDTCSDVSLARRDILTNVRVVADPVVVGHLGGESLLRQAGAFRLDRMDGGNGIVLNDVFSIDPELLPAGVILLIGVGDIMRLNISLDAVLAHPDRPWEQAIVGGVFAGFFRLIRSLCSRARPPAHEPEARAYLASETCPLIHQVPRFAPVETNVGAANLQACERYELKIDYITMDQVCTWSQY